MNPSRVAFTGKELLFAVLLCGLCLVCLCTGLLPATFHVVAGWAFFLFRVVPEVRLNPSVLLTAGISLAGVVLGVHLLARWLVRSLSPRPPECPPRRWSFVSTLAVVGLVVLAFSAGIGAVGVTHQTAWLARSPEPIFVQGAIARMRSSNNLRQIGEGWHNFDGTQGALPAIALDKDGRALHGWMTHLLPYIEQNILYRTIDLARPWDDPVNARHFQTQISTYTHSYGERYDERGFSLTHYALNARLLDGGRLPRIEKIQEGRGTSNTLFAGEARGNWKPWGHPTNWRDPGLGLNRSPDGFGSPIRSVAVVNLLLADGSVRTFDRDTDPDFLALLAGK